MSSHAAVAFLSIGVIAGICSFQFIAFYYGGKLSDWIHADKARAKKAAPYMLALASFFLLWPLRQHHSTPAYHVSLSGNDDNWSREVLPDYPFEAKQRRLVGEVLVKARVLPDGRVESAATIAGPPLLASATQTAIPGWRYRTGILKEPEDKLIRVRFYWGDFQP